MEGERDRRQLDMLERRGLPPREGPPLPDKAPDAAPKDPAPSG